MASQLNQSQLLFGFDLMKDTVMLLERTSKYKSFFDNKLVLHRTLESPSAKRETYEERIIERGESELLTICDHDVKGICQP